MYFTYVTSKPRNACISVVCIIAFTVFLVLFYGCLVRRQENIINEFTKLAFADDVTRDAVLLAKKIYVRYISHEMRTPLNAAYLGLKIVEKDLIAKKGTLNMDTVATVRDVMDACDIAIEFLNDLLNYDKLENRTLMIEKKSVVALPFILSTIKLFNIQAEEKGINLVLDVEDNGACVLMEGGQSLMYSSSADAVDDHDLWRNQGRGLKLSLTHSAYVGADECISIDENKMSQVIRNLISNAMKFTPGGRTVTIRVRKEVRKPGRNVDAAFNDLSLSLSLPQSMKRRSIFQPIWGTSTRTVTPTRTVAPTRAGSVANSRANSRRLATPPGRYQNEIVREGFWPPTGVSSNSVFPDIPEQVSVFFSRREAKEKVIEYDTLVLDVIDEGVGMVAEDSRRVFKDVIQFDPSQLQVLCCVIFLIV